MCKCTASGAGDIYYHIKPSINASCPGEPCLTLSQFAAHTGDYIESNTSLLFLPGQHNLSLEINITAISNLSLTSKPTLSNSPSATIACEGNASLIFSNIAKVYIGHLRFSGCYGHKSISVQMFVLKNSLFISHRGSALEFISSIVIIVSSSFIVNSPGSYQHLLREFGHGEDINAHSGAALALTQSSVHISGCVFKENHAEFGGAIFSLYSLILINNTLFEQNYANCVYHGFGSTRVSCVGGAMYSADTTVEVYNSTFYNNTLMNKEGYTVYQYGGVFALFDSKLIIAEQSVFEQNRAQGFSSDSYGGVVHAYYAEVNISNSIFKSNSIGAYGGVLSMSNGQCIINSSKFVNNSVFTETDLDDLLITGGGVLYLQIVNITIMNSTFEENIAVGNGGVIMTACISKMCSILTIIDSTFSRNEAQFGGVLYFGIGMMNIVNISGCEFSNNSAEETGGVIESSEYDLINQYNQYSITISFSTFTRNKVKSSGGVLNLNYATILLHRCEFVDNRAYSGGIVFAMNTNLTIVRNLIVRNHVIVGVIYVTKNSSINFYHTVIKDNTANTGTICLFYSTGVLSTVVLVNNTGSIFIAFSNIIFIGGKISGSTSWNTNETQILGLSNINSDDAVVTTYQEGGAITMFHSTIEFKGSYSVIGNHAVMGGAILASESRIYVYDQTVIAHNRASKFGGGVYMYRSELNCYTGACFIEIVNNKCGSKGGGVHAIGSTIITWDEGTIRFQGNYAQFAGGGVCLELNSKLYILIANFYKTNFYFVNNSAKYGGAVYVADETTSGTCASESQSTTTECFIQPFSINAGKYIGDYRYVVKFINNTASISGPTLYGGLLDRCKSSPFANKKIVPHIEDGVTYLKNFSNIRNLDSITSSPVRVCFCNTSHQPDCSYDPPTVPTEKGKLFTVTLVAVDQVNNTIPNVTIRSSLSSSSGGLGENQLNQSTGVSCTDLSFQVFSPRNSEQLILFADGPCKDAPMSQRRVEINFTPCTCPLGFQVKCC